MVHPRVHKISMWENQQRGVNQHKKVCQVATTYHTDFNYTVTQQRNTSALSVILQLSNYNFFFDRCYNMQ